MKLAVRHDTSYAYEGQVTRSTQYIRLTPLSTRRQQVYHWELELPVNASIIQDAYGNHVHVMTLDRPHQDIAIHARGMVEITETDESDRGRVNPLYFLRDTALTRSDETLRTYAQGFLQGRDMEASLERLMHDLLARVPYTPGSTLVTEAAAASFAKGQGVCQDHAHIFIACCRSLGVPARYVSGYIHAGDDEGHVSSHAWVEAWIEGVWRTFDVTNGLTRPERHLKLAIGLDYLEACPVRGVRWGGDQESMTAHAAVTLVEAGADQ